MSHHAECFRTWSFRRCFAIAVALPFLSLISGPEAQSGPGVEIASLATEKCLDVEGGSLSSGADVIQFTCNGSANQHWRVQESHVSGRFYLQNEKSGLCLDVRIGGPQDGTLQQYTCHYRGNQLFLIVRMLDTTAGVRLIAQHSSHCLDVPGGQGTDNLYIQQWPCHSGINQRWMYAEPGPYVYPLVVAPISRLDFLLEEGRTYVFELANLEFGETPVLHLWNSVFGDAAFNFGPSPSNLNVSRIEYTAPAGSGRRLYRLFVYARQSTGPGAAALTVFEDGRVLQTRENVTFGGTVVDVPDSSSDKPYGYQTALAPGDVTDTVLLALGAGGRMVAYDEDSAVGKAAGWVDSSSITQVVVGAYDGPGAAIFYVNDGFRDRDGDGLGYGLERELGTCDLQRVQARCREVYNLQDTDRDGLIDTAEVLGIEAAKPLHLPRWGASPVHKDVFVEVDYTTRYPRMPMAEADAEAIRDYFVVGGAADLKNPDGANGVSIHLDLGFDPQNPSNRTLMGDWGGSNAIPKDHADKLSFRVPERRNVFFHAVLDTGGTSLAVDSFAFSLQGGNARNRVRTFVHELGHVLNLEHEAGTGERPLGLNCSPIYSSIMNYASDAGFADGTEYPNVVLNPARLCEEEGLNGGDLSHLAKYAIPTSGTAVDWNRDGRIETCDRRVRARVNWFPFAGCATHVQGQYGEQQDEPPLVRGSSPSLARLGDRLFLFYLDESNRLRYISSLQSARWPESGCPLGFRESISGYAQCTEWSVSMSTPEAGRVAEIKVLIVDRVGDDGQLSNWLRTAIPGSRADEAPALGLLYEYPDGPVTQDGGRRLLVAVWPDEATRTLEAAHIDLARKPKEFLGRLPPKDAAGSSIRTNGAPTTLAFWGRDDGRSLKTNQTWMALADGGSRIRVYRYDPNSRRWQDKTASGFTNRPGDRIKRRMGFAFRPLLDAGGQMFEPLKGEFTLAYGATDAGAPLDRRDVGSIWISDVVSEARPPDQYLRFPSNLAGRFGHPWYGIGLRDQGGFDLYSDPAFPFLKGAAVRLDSRIAFLAYADGIFDLDFMTGSDFQVMRRGICFRLRDRDTQFCGPPDPF